MSQFTYLENKLHIDGNDIIFEYKIKAVLQICNVLIVLLKKPIGVVDNENVYGVSKKGVIIWKIQKNEYVDKSSPFMNIYTKNNELWLGNWGGNEYRVDPTTGKILEKKFTK